MHMQSQYGYSLPGLPAETRREVCSPPVSPSLRLALMIVKISLPPRADYVLTFKMKDGCERDQGHTHLAVHNAMIVVIWSLIPASSNTVKGRWARQHSREKREREKAKHCSGGFVKRDRGGGQVAVVCCWWGSVVCSVWNCEDVKCILMVCP